MAEVKQTGREVLNRQIHRLVFQQPGAELLETPIIDWSGDITRAWKVVAHTEAQGWVWEIGNCVNGVRQWHARAWVLLSPFAAAPTPSPWARGSGAPEAICRAAIAALHSLKAQGPSEVIPPAAPRVKKKKKPDPEP